MAEIVVLGKNRIRYNMREQGRSGMVGFAATRDTRRIRELFHS